MVEGIAKSIYELRGKLGGAMSSVVDNTLSIEGAAADAKATGDAIAAVNADLATKTENYDKNFDLYNQMSIQLKNRLTECENDVEGMQDAVDKAQTSADGARVIAEETQAQMEQFRQENEVLGTASLNFANWNGGSFTETMSDGTVITHVLGFNGSGDVISIDDISVSGVF